MCPTPPQFQQLSCHMKILRAYKGETKVPYPHVHTRRALPVRSGWKWGWALLSHVLHWVKTYLEMTFDTNRGLRAISNWAYTREDTVILLWLFRLIRNPQPSSVSGRFAVLVYDGIGSIGWMVPLLQGRLVNHEKQSTYRIMPYTSTGCEDNPQRVSVQITRGSSHYFQ